MVDDTRLELVTSRTSSGCATSCANRPALYQHEVFYIMEGQMSRFFSSKSQIFRKKEKTWNKRIKKANDINGISRGEKRNENDKR